MSLEDESFPNDAFLDEMELPRNEIENKPINTSITSSTTEHNIASNLSAETNASDPIGLADNDDAAIHKKSKQQNQKSTSFQDLHSEYTRRRFKHVVSKVGQYIASVKAEDEKRRSLSAKFQRHSSMPETLTPESLTSSDARDLGYCMNNGNDDDIKNRHELSGDADIMTYEQLSNEKDRIQSYADYLQTRLNEQIDEKIVLQRKVDILRIELYNSQEKCKRQQQANAVNRFNGNLLTPMGGSVGTLPYHSRQSLNYRATKSTQTDFITFVTQSQLSQTDASPQLRSGDFYVTPDTTDVNNYVHESSNDSNSEPVDNLNIGVLADDNMNVSSIEPQALNFSHSDIIDEVDTNVNAQRLHSDAIQPKTTINNKQTTDHSGTSCPSSNDSAIEIEVVDVRPSPKHSSITLRRKTRGKYVVYNNNSNNINKNMTSCHDTALESFNDIEFDEGTNVSTFIFTREPKFVIVQQHQSQKRKKTLRSRILRLFSPCARCDDPNQTINASGIHESYTQIPLLEKSFQNHCRN